MNYWLIVDVIRLPDAVEVLTQHLALEQVIPLYAGTMFDSVLEFSPILMNLGSSRQTALSCFTLKGFDSSAVVFEVSDHIHADAFLAHLQSLLIVNIGRHPMMLRFYTNAFWEAYAQDLNDSDKLLLLGEASAVNWLSSNQRLQILSRPEGRNVTPPYALTSSIFKQ